MIYKKRKEPIVQFECCKDCARTDCLGTKPITTSSNARRYGKAKLPCYKGETK